MPQPKPNQALKDHFKYFGPGTFIIVLSFMVAFLFIKPAPPRTIVIGAGGPEGDYYRVAQRFRVILARDGIRLDVRATEGSFDNLSLLEAGEIDVAFIQGGTGSKATVEDLISLGSLYYEPIWGFYRRDLSLSPSTPHKGLRIGTAGEGSATLAMAETVLPLLGASPDDTFFVEVRGSERSDMLLDGKLDLAFVVYGFEAPVIQRLLRSEKLAPFSLDRAEALARRYRHLSIVTLPQGIVAFAPDIPDRDIHMLAPTAQLAIRSEFHPALIPLFIEAAEEIFGRGGIFEEAGEFPSLKLIDFNTNKDIRRFYKSGPTFLRRYLPFWVANFLDRMKIMLVPLLAVLFPFFKVMPPLYRWRIRYKIFRWYRELESLDPELYHVEIKGRLQENLARLDKLEQNVSNVSVPLGFRESLYTLRIHIDMIRSKLLKLYEEEKHDPFFR